MPSGSYSEQRKNRAAIPVPDAAKLRGRVIRKLLAIVEGDERPEAVVAASRVLLDLPTERERPSEDAQVSSAESRRAEAARLVAEAFGEVMAREPEPPLLELAPAPAATAMTQALPAPAEPAVPINIKPVAKPIPFDRRYGRRLNRHY